MDAAELELRRRVQELELELATLRMTAEYACRTLDLVVSHLESALNGVTQIKAVFERPTLATLYEAQAAELEAAATQFPHVMGLAEMATTMGAEWRSAARHVRELPELVADAFVFTDILEEAVSLTSGVQAQLAGKGEEA